MTHRTRAWTRERVFCAAVLVLSVALTAPVAVAVGGQGTDGTLTLDTANGNTAAVSPLTFTTGAACAEGATNVKLTIKGAGFAGTDNADGSTNAVGRNPVPEGAATLPAAAVLGSTWDSLAQDKAAPIPLTGPAIVRLVCQNDDGEELGAFATTITFTPNGTSSTYTATGGAVAASPTPTTAPSTSPTPTRTTLPTTTPDPSASATPTPKPDGEESPTPEPDADQCVSTETSTTGAATESTGDECADVTTDGAGTTTGETLPGTGGNKPTGLTALAVLLLIAGLLFLALAVEPRGLRSDEDWDERL